MSKFRSDTCDFTPTNWLRHSLKGADEVGLPQFNSFHSIFIGYTKINFSKYHISHWQDEHCEVRFINLKKGKTKTFQLFQACRKYVKTFKISFFHGHRQWVLGIWGIWLFVSESEVPLLYENFVIWILYMVSLMFWN